IKRLIALKRCRRLKSQPRSSPCLKPGASRSFFGEACVYHKLDRESRAAWEEKRQRDDRVPIGHNTRNHLLTRSITPPNEAATL
ncbi:hypothetical protein, partial [Microcoleus sp.]|uniref:hypothetical protein n=1 Tax=Microcoleus sp. TaxID=44472 RepID=UPI003524C0AB